MACSYASKRLVYWRTWHGAHAESLLFPYKLTLSALQFVKLPGTDSALFAPGVQNARNATALPHSACRYMASCFALSQLRRRV